MKFGLAMHGTRGDIEPCSAIGLELLRRGHEVRKAVPPSPLIRSTMGMAWWLFGANEAGGRHLAP
jgi:hypothetical protein